MDAVSAARTAGFQLGAMHADDIAPVLDIEQQIYAFPWTRGNFEDSLASGYTCRLLRHGKRLVGYGVMMRIVDEAHLLNITIVTDRQRTGIGSLLLRSLCDEARSHGAARVILEVRASNGAGHAFYRRHGFVQIGERMDYYPAKHGREAALVLEKQI